MNQLKRLGSNILRRSAEIRAVTAREGGFTENMVMKEIYRGLQEIRDNNHSLPSRYPTGVFNVAYDATPLMIPRLVVPFVQQTSMGKLVLRFPSMLKETAKLWQEILSEWNIETTTDTKVIEREASPHASLLMMGSNKIREAALEWSKKYGKVVFAGPTGMQKIIIEDSLDSQEHPQVAKFVVIRSLLNAGQYCFLEREVVIGKHHVESFLPCLSMASKEWVKERLIGKLVKEKQERFDQEVDRFRKFHPDAIQIPFANPRGSIPRIFLTWDDKYSPKITQTLEPFGPFLHIRVVPSVTQAVLERLNWSGNMVLATFGKQDKLQYPTLPIHLRNTDSFEFSDPSWKVGGPLTQHFVSVHGDLSRGPFHMVTELYH